MKNKNRKQFTSKRGSDTDDSYEHDEETNGTSQERRHQRIIAKMAKKYKVPVSAAKGAQQGGGDAGGGMGMM